MKRRTFLQLGVAASPSLFGIPNVIIRDRNSEGKMLFKGGMVFDGLGSAPMVADVLIEGDRILAVGQNLDPGNGSTISIRGMAIAPGFVDIHGHTDLSLLFDARAFSKVHQGVTTEVIGQDGDSVGPMTEEKFELLRERFREKYGVVVDFRYLPEFFAALTRSGISMNIASMIGTGTVREYVVGLEDREATAAEIKEMQTLIRAAIRNGACGLSSGLEYLPGAFADTDELIALASVLKGTGLPYATHMRNEDDSGLGAIEEAIHIGRMAGVPVQLSHLKASGRRNWNKARIGLAMVDAARAEGFDVTADRYPYVAYSTGLSALFPVWAREGGTDDFIARLEDPATAGKIKDAVLGKIARMGDWDAAQVTSTVDTTLYWANGKNLNELGVAQSRDPYDVLTDLIIGDRSRTGMVGFGMSEENTELTLSHPATMICSDGGAKAPTGPLSVGSPHPRCYGSFPRVLGYYCRERGIFPLETAIKKMTSMPADRIGLTQRGRIAEGTFADLVVFDAETVADRATFAEPHQTPVGIQHVLVNGEFVISNGQHTERKAGRVVAPTVSTK